MSIELQNRVLELERRVEALTLRIAELEKKPDPKDTVTLAWQKDKRGEAHRR